MLARHQLRPNCCDTAQASSSRCTTNCPIIRGSVFRAPPQHQLRSWRLLQASDTDQARAEAQQSVLQQLFSWAAANGVYGLDEGTSKLGIYEAEDGDRGMMAVQLVREDELLLVVPLRLALTDHAGDEESVARAYEGAPWGVRLAAKLLREKAKGEASPWHRYIQSLPAQVPTPLVTFGWEDMSLLEYEPVKQDLYYYCWLVSNSYIHMRAEDMGHASSEEWQWAMAVVHSRTFGSASPDGGSGVGVRMLLPLVDFFNHSALEVGPDGEVMSTDSCRWELAGPERSLSGEWEMHVTATHRVPAGEPLCLSYGDGRNNDDFLVYYGFIPPRNPHDDVVLFEDLEGALEWYTSLAADGDENTAQLLRQWHAEAEAAASREDILLDQGSHAAALSEGQLAKEHGRIRLVHGSQVDGRLLAAWRVLANALPTPGSSPPSSPPSASPSTPPSITPSASAPPAVEAASNGAISGFEAGDGNGGDGSSSGATPEARRWRRRRQLDAAEALVQGALLLRCCELLDEWAPVEGDLKALWLHGRGGDAQLWQAMHRRYSRLAQVCRAQLAALGIAGGGPHAGLAEDELEAAAELPLESDGLLTRPAELSATYRVNKKAIVWDAVAELLAELS